MFIVKILIALVIGAIVYAVVKPILTHFGIDSIWGYILAVIAAGTYYFAAPDTLWRRP